MYMGRARHDWDQTARLLWQQANLHSKKPLPIKRFHPFYQPPPAAPATAAPKASVKVLKSIFVDGGRVDDVLAEVYAAEHPEVAKALIPLRPT